MQTDYKEKSTITVDENDVLAFAKKIERNQLEDKTFSEKIDEYIGGKLRPDEVLKIGTTPYCLRAVGANAIPLVVTQGVIANSMESSTIISKSISKKHTEQHNIPESVIKNIPQALRNPVLICKGNLRDTLVVISDLKNKEQQNVIVPMVLNVKGQHGRVNRITTIHGKKNIQNFLNKAIADNSILAMNTKKADELFSDIGIQSPQSTTIICFDNSIAYSTQNVKRPEQNLQYDNIIDKLSSDGKAEINDDGSFKINNDFYRELPRDDRATEVVPARHAMEIMQQLSDSGIEFSAVSRQNDNAAITVHKDKIDILKHTAENIAEKTIRQDDVKSSDSDKINPEYYNKLKKDERKVIRLPHNSGDKAISALQSAGIPFSAVKSEKLTSITVHKDNAQALDQIISDSSKQTAKEYINSDFFKSLPPEERLYTQISGTDKANELMSELKNNNIGFSAVIDKEKNSAKVTVAKKDTSALKKVTDSLFSRKAQKDFSDKAKSLNQEHNTRNIAKNKDNQHSI